MSKITRVDRAHPNLMEHIYINRTMPRLLGIRPYRLMLLNLKTGEFHVKSFWWKRRARVWFALWMMMEHDALQLSSCRVHCYDQTRDITISDMQIAFLKIVRW